MRYYLSSSVPCAPGAITDRSRRPLKKKKKQARYVFGGPKSAVATKAQLMAEFTALSTVEGLPRQNH